MGVLLLLIVAGLVVSSLAHFDQSINTLAQMDRSSESLCFYYERFAKYHSCILGPSFGIRAVFYPMISFPV
jgi:high-affinity iron transporter